MIKTSIYLMLSLFIAGIAIAEPPSTLLQLRDYQMPMSTEYSNTYIDSKNQNSLFYGYWIDTSVLPKCSDHSEISNVPKELQGTFIGKIKSNFQSPTLEVNSSGVKRLFILDYNDLDSNDYNNGFRKGYMNLNKICFSQTIKSTDNGHLILVIKLQSKNLYSDVLHLSTSSKNPNLINVSSSQLKLPFWNANFGENYRKFTINFSNYSRQYWKKTDSDPIKIVKLTTSL